MLEQTYKTVKIAPEGQEDRPLILLNTTAGRQALWDTVAAGDPDTRWVVTSGEEMTYPEHQALEAHAGW